MTATHLVDGLIVFLLLEWLWLSAWRRRRARTLPAATYRYSLLSGLALVVALRVVLAGGGTLALAACLVLAGACHALDLLHRLAATRSGMET